MPGREHERIPLSIRVQFRNASSFLVAYSVNLSRGGLFLESDHPAEVGSDITLQLAAPEAGPISVHGVVTWRREQATEDGPAGFGVEFGEMVEDLSGLIDRLVSQFTEGELGINVLIVCTDRQDLSTLRRMVRSIITTAHVVSAPDVHVAETLVDDVDLAVIDADSDSEGTLRALAAASSSEPGIPCIVLSSSEEIRQQALARGAQEVAANPPPFEEFRRLLVRALGRPQLVRPT